MCISRILDSLTDTQYNLLKMFLRNKNKLHKFRNVLKRDTDLTRLTEGNIFYINTKNKKEEKNEGEKYDEIYKENKSRDM